jgi:hypothetical protein
VVVLLSVVVSMIAPLKAKQSAGSKGG